VHYRTLFSELLEVHAAPAAVTPSQRIAVQS
jgi:hypothetical protein